ncbi:TatD family deoxyribonuclease [Deinococcus irradiatisoli]|uniref:TatD family deoxyribonuclease n=1 Tax=Deinococcus irradiatisoli TaxID=2202254 RepID=A0A2Z3JFV2_9DEIO|nr:TatD family hydrolase [Deinococcus irradiatisoli]AWN22250.1 TatD family deoxyribonuclease [Deinococcus irradiatisoli]
MIDTHCHLDYLDDPASALGELGLSALVCIGADPQHARSALALAEKYPEVYASVGLHPTEVAQQDTPETRAELEALSLHGRVVAIGESGLDDYWDHDQLPAQRRAFEWQLDLGRRRDLPVVVHTRDAAGGERASLGCAEVIRDVGWTKGILHCCNGHAGLMRAALDLGWYVSFAGNLTYKTAQAIQEAARFVPAGRLLVETDAPFLAPVPKRGKPNRPGYVRYTLQFLAELRGLSESEMEQLTDANARAVYRLNR